MAHYPLDGELFYLGRDVPGVIDLLMLKTERAKAVLLFSSEALAQAHLASLEPALETRMRLHRLEADDFRAKEEVCLAGLAQGAVELWFDVQADSLEPSSRQPLPRALAYIRSFKNETTCL